METIKCKQCGKKIEGYNKRHVKFLMKQHQLSHEKYEDEEDDD